MIDSEPVETEHDVVLRHVSALNVVTRAVETATRRLSISVSTSDLKSGIARNLFREGRRKRREERKKECVSDQNTILAPKLFNYKGESIIEGLSTNDDNFVEFDDLSSTGDVANSLVSLEQCSTSADVMEGSSLMSVEIEIVEEFNEPDPGLWSSCVHDQMVVVTDTYSQITGGIYTDDGSSINDLTHESAARDMLHNDHLNLFSRPSDDTGDEHDNDGNGVEDTVNCRSPKSARRKLLKEIIVNTVPGFKNGKLVAKDIEIESFRRIEGAELKKHVMQKG